VAKHKVLWVRKKEETYLLRGTEYFFNSYKKELLKYNNIDNQLDATITVY